MAAEYRSLEDAAYNLVVGMDDVGRALYWAVTVEERAKALLAALAQAPAPGRMDCDAVRVATIAGAAAYASLVAETVVRVLTTFHILPVIPTS